MELTTHSLVVDVGLQDRSSIETLFVSNLDGISSENLKDSISNDTGYIDYYVKLYGGYRMGLANTFSNAKDVEGRGAWKTV